MSVSVAAVATNDRVPPWALRVTAPESARTQVINSQVTRWTTSSLGWIDSLPVPDALKWHLEGALWTARRTFLNQAPTVAPVTVTGSGGTTVTGRVDAIDPEGDLIVFRLVRGPSTGTVQLNPDGTFSYIPGAGFTGVDTFVIQARDLGLHVNLVDPFRGVGTAADALVNQGAVTFTFDYTSGSQYWSADARNALQEAANDVAAYLLVKAPVVIDYEVTGLSDAAEETLASAGSDLVGDEPGFWRTVVQHEIISGVDSNGMAADGEIEWNWSYPWALGDDVDAGSYDFTSTAMHELLHSLGFLSYVDAPGSNTDRAWTLFDRYVMTAGGTRPMGDDFRWNGNFDPRLTGTGGGFFFGGAHAVAAYGGLLVPLYTPNPWEDGSSMSHLDDSTFTGSNQQLMNARTGTGLGVRVLSPIEIGILRDLGYDVVVPQAPTTTLALAGVIVIGRLRTRQVRAAR
ncbi:hypothetical protein GCM10023114_22500 [Mycolicibacterium sediminis]|uniref:Uncharacterized protein n=2 Tax=Mycolicibacterium sediminis TaxID=1286180 RepID=A0A7I7QJQ7_9MYCO|nr:hypothetical protein MSEDJ_06010 [Mycolicibacterium sediminis]